MLFFDLQLFHKHHLTLLTDSPLNKEREGMIKQYILIGNSKIDINHNLRLKARAFPCPIPPWFRHSIKTLVSLTLPISCFLLRQKRKSRTDALKPSHVLWNTTEIIFVEQGLKNQSLIYPLSKISDWHIDVWSINFLSTVSLSKWKDSNKNWIMMRLFKVEQRSSRISLKRNN